MDDLKNNINKAVGTLVDEAGNKIINTLDEIGIAQELTLHLKIESAKTSELYGIDLKIRKLK